MVQKDRFRLLLCVFLLVAFIFVYPAFAEIKVFEKEVEEIVGRDQSQEQVEAFALQKAKRLAVEEAGIFLSSLTVVQNYQLQKDVVTVLASGVTKSQVLGVPSVVVKKGFIHVTVKAKITVDTAVLDQQIKEIMKEKGTLKKLETEQRKVRDLEEKLANLKSSELKRLEELNAQALALERERDKQRLFHEEQALKAKGELSRAEADRLAREREMQDRINRTLAEQEKAKREEAAALAAEQDRIKRAQLENEQRWNELSRKAKLSQESWVADDSLSLKQAIAEVNDLKREIANLKGRLDYQYGENTRNLKAAYAQQRALTKAKLPPEPALKDAFETTKEYNERISAYERQTKAAERENGEALKMLYKEENLKLAEAKVDYLGQQIRVLAPFVKRLQDLQTHKFIFPEGGTVTVALGEPDADTNRFPLNLQHKGKSWSTWWNYMDRNIAKDFYRTRAYLKTEGFFQIEGTAKTSAKLTAVRVTHLATKEVREFHLDTPRTFAEIDQLEKLKREETTAQKTSENAAKIIRSKKIGYNDRFVAYDDRFLAYDDGTVLDMQTNLMWASKDNGNDINWVNAKSYCENYRGGGYTDWRMPTQDELAGLYYAGKTYKSDCGHYAHLTELIRLTCTVPWASDTRGSDAASFYFSLGTRSWHAQSIDNGLRGLPVRSHK